MASAGSRREACQAGYRVAIKLIPRAETTIISNIPPFHQYRQRGYVINVTGQFDKLISFQNPAQTHAAQQSQGRTH